MELALKTREKPADLGLAHELIDELHDRFERQEKNHRGEIDFLRERLRYLANLLFAAKCDRVDVSLFNEAELMGELGQAGEGDDDAQPSTVKSASGTKYPAVSIGTGRYLGLSDLSNKSQHKIYAIKDPLLPTGWGDFRTNGSALNETVALSGNSGTVGSTVIGWSTQAGWYVDLPGAGERLAIDMVKANGSLIAISATPGGTDCSPVGSSVLYEISLTKGVGTVEKLGDFLVAGFSVIKVNSSGPNAADGTLKIVGVRGDSSPFTKDLGGAINNPPGTPHRSSWRAACHGGRLMSDGARLAELLRAGS